MSCGAGAGPSVFGRCSNSPIRQAFTPRGSTPRTSVDHSPSLRTLAVMLSMVRPTDMASKPSLSATTSIHSRVRKAVLPARSIEAPNHSSTSKASPAVGQRHSCFGCRRSSMCARHRRYYRFVAGERRKVNPPRFRKPLRQLRVKGGIAFGLRCPDRRLLLRHRAFTTPWPSIDIRRSSSASCTPSSRKCSIVLTT